MYCGTETENDNVNNSGDSEAVDGCAAESPADVNHHTVSTTVSTVQWDQLNDVFI